MTKVVTVTPYCDGEHTNRTPATVERKISLDDSGPIVLDLCAEHDEGLAGLRMLLKAGVPVKRGPRSHQPKSQQVPEGEGVLCPEPGCSERKKNRASLAQHVRHAHGGKNLVDYGWPES